MNDKLAKIGIKDPTFDFLTVKQLVDKDILERPLDGNHGETHPKGADFVESGIPFIMASDINDGVVDYKTCKFITSKQAESLRKGFAKNGDVLLTHKATIGRTAIVNYDKQPYVMLTPQVTYYRVRDSKKLNNRYLRFYFESTFFQKILNLWAGSGSTRAYLGITEQGKLPVVLPPFSKQEKIAAILSAYDDLIENNKRRISLLEKMTEEIYREWFVRLRFPGHELIKFEKGFPEGWHHIEIGKLSKLIKRGISPTYNDFSDKLIINQRCIRNGVVDLAEARKHDSKVPDEKIIRFGDVLINSTGVGTLGRVSVFDHEYSDLTCDTHVTICRHDPEKITISYFSHALLSLQNYFENMAIGSTGQSELGRGLIAKTKILKPSIETQELFASAVKPMYEERRFLTRQLLKLSKTRDLLLPRLISGRFSVESVAIQLPPSMQEAA